MLVTPSFANPKKAALKRGDKFSEDLSATGAGVMRSRKHGLAEHGFARYRYEGPQVEGSAHKAMGTIGLNN